MTKGDNIAVPPKLRCIITTISCLVTEATRYDLLNFNHTVPKLPSRYPYLRNLAAGEFLSLTAVYRYSSSSLHFQYVINNTEFWGVCQGENQFVLSSSQRASYFLVSSLKSSSASHSFKSFNIRLLSSFRDSVSIVSLAFFVGK